MNPIVLTFEPVGMVRGLYSELIDLSELGPLQVVRASSLEFNQKKQKWEVKEPNGKTLFSHKSRAVCLAWEHDHFNR
jgi:hypothetical protein